MAAKTQKYIITKHGIFLRTVKPVNRNGKQFYRDSMGQEYPAHMVRDNLTEKQRIQFEEARHELLRREEQFDRLVHPENY